MNKSEHKNDSRTKSTKNRKILLGTLIPIALIIIALCAFLTWWFAFRKTSGSGSTGQNKLSALINKDTINDSDGKYKVPKGTPIQYGPLLTITLDHDLFNLEKFSLNHGGVTNFDISGEVNFGFLVGFNIDCKLTGINNELTNLNNVTGTACGIIVGVVQGEPTPSSWAYSKNMNIEPSMTFNIRSSSPSARAYGVHIGPTGPQGTLKINGTFSIYSANLARGFYAAGIAASSTIIDGVFTISGVESYGVYFYEFVSGPVTINTTFTIYATEKGYGVFFRDSIIEPVVINGVFFISTPISLTSGVEYCGVWLKNSFNEVTINGWFVLSTASISDKIFSVYLDDSVESLNMTAETTKFLSNKTDKTNIFDQNKLPDEWAGSYQWNGETIDKSKPDTSGDSVLALKIITTNDVDSDNNPWFSINVIDHAANSTNKDDFNNAYKTALQSYVATCDDSIAKPWLESIINQILT